MLISLILAASVLQTRPSPEGDAILKRIMASREMAGPRRASEIKSISREVAEKLKGDERVTLAAMVAASATEGDNGKEAVQIAADALAKSLKVSPAAPEHGQPAYPYVLLAQLHRYEGVRVNLKHAEYLRAARAIDETYAARAKADFTLNDLEGRAWRRSALKGKVVLLNFWATWCPPCRKEMPDLQALYLKFRAKGLVVLAVSDEDPVKVSKFAKDSKWAFPVLLDKGGAVGKRFRLESFPKSFVYDRAGKLVATGIDMRTRGQFLRMLAAAGLQ